MTDIWPDSFACGEGKGEGEGALPPYLHQLDSHWRRDDGVAVEEVKYLLCRALI